MNEEVFTPAFFRRLQQLSVFTRRSFLGGRQGTHLSTRRGHGLEFADYRAYAPGDDFRHIDWGIYGRTDRLYVRQYREEQDLAVTLLVDVSRSMAFPAGENKFEFAQGFAQALGYVGLVSGDTVTVACIPGGRPTQYVGPHASRRMMRSLEEIAPTGRMQLSESVRQILERVRRPGKCFLVSDFLCDVDDIADTVLFLRSKNYDAVLCQVLAPQELSLPAGDMGVVVDAETGEELEVAVDAEGARQYHEMISAHLRACEDFALNAGYQHLVMLSNENLSDVVLRRLPELGILR